jgi:hypothetical protein
MKKTLSKYLNIYVVISLIGIFSFLYLFSFAFVLNDVATGSSSAIKKQFCLKNPAKCKTKK